MRILGENSEATAEGRGVAAGAARAQSKEPHEHTAKRGRGLVTDRASAGRASSRVRSPFRSPREVPSPSPLDYLQKRTWQVPRFVG
jgi:hypothetical protein